MTHSLIQVGFFCLLLGLLLSGLIALCFRWGFEAGFAQRSRLQEQVRTEEHDHEADF